MSYVIGSVELFCDECGETRSAAVHMNEPAVVPDDVKGSNKLTVMYWPEVDHWFHVCPGRDDG